MSVHFVVPSSAVEEVSTTPEQFPEPDRGQDTRPSSTARRSTEPLTPKATIASRPRNRSPYARGHLRTHSTSTSSPAPPMIRAHTSPLSESFNNLHITPLRPSSPLFSSPRRSSPLRRPLDETFSSFSSSLDIAPTISENSELDLTPRNGTDELAPPLTPNSPFNATFPRSRRRPSSPLHHLLPSPLQKTSPLHTSTSSPTLGAAAASPGRYIAPTVSSSPRFNEAYPSSFYSQSSGSVPSTPTSFRSRSPSMSSLETIPDAPDAEATAMEADAMAKLKAAADGEDSKKKGTDRSSNAAGRDKRKRWSVCGAERRGDLDLETIWED